MLFMEDGKIEEDVPTNNVGGGNIAGTGIGPQGEPGVPVKKKKKFKEYIYVRGNTPTK
jgi:hypothetical protein